MPTPEDPQRKEVSFEMIGYLEQAVAAYREQTGFSGKLPDAPTPFLAEEFDGDGTWVGKHAVAAQSILPKLLYAARLARPDLIFAINLLSRFLTMVRVP